MLRSLTIRNFKRFRELSFPELKRVNLLAGKNNTGKTGVLEALYLLFEHSLFEPGAPFKRYHQAPAIFRNPPSLAQPEVDYWRWLLHGGKADEIASVLVHWGEGPEQGVLVSAPRDATYASPLNQVASVETPTGYDAQGGLCLLGERLWLRDVVRQNGPGRMNAPCPLRELGAVPLSAFPADLGESRKNYDKVVLKQDGEKRIEALLARIEPRLKGIRSLEPYGTKLLYVDIGLPEKIPATHLGEGFNRLLSMYCQLIASGKRVMLIDEFENGLHYSTLTEVWRGVAHLAAQENIQVFATTHSYECIRAAHEAFAETREYDFALHRLEEVNGEIGVTTYTKETLQVSLESNFEIR